MSEFREALARRFGENIQCLRGQSANNCGHLSADPKLRRLGKVRVDETFELGDLRADLVGQTVIVEFESDWVAVHNLVKYWPFIRGELSTRPVLPVVLCHFSNWSSYGSYRDLWKWMEARMASDQQRVVDFCGHQFDHGGQDRQLRGQSISEAISWLADRINHRRPTI